MYLGAGGAVPVFLTQGAVLRCQQQVVLSFPRVLRAELQVQAGACQAAGQGGAPAAGLVRQAGQAGLVPRAGAGAVRLQEQEGNLLQGDKKDR